MIGRLVLPVRVLKPFNTPQIIVPKHSISLRGHISVAKIYNPPPFAFAKIDFEKPVARYVNITIERHIKIALEMAHLKQEEILAA